MGFMVPEWWLERREGQQAILDSGYLLPVGDGEGSFVFHSNHRLTCLISILLQGQTETTAYGSEGESMAGGWPFFFMMAKEAIDSGMPLGMHYGKPYWGPILKAEKAVKAQIDKLEVSICKKFQLHHSLFHSPIGAQLERENRRLKEELERTKQAAADSAKQLGQNINELVEENRQLREENRRLREDKEVFEQLFEKASEVAEEFCAELLLLKSREKSSSSETSCAACAAAVTPLLETPVHPTSC